MHEVIDFRAIKDRDKPMVRLHPDLYKQIKLEAEARNIGKTEMLEKAAWVGLNVLRALESITVA